MDGYNLGNGLTLKPRGDPAPENGDLVTPKMTEIPVRLCGLKFNFKPYGRNRLELPSRQVFFPDSILNLFYF